MQLSPAVSEVLVGLIKQGARLVDCVEDVMETLGYIGQGLKEHVSSSATKAKENVEMPLFDAGRLNLSENERSIYQSLGPEAAHVEEVIAKTGLTAGQINSGLISLRLKGLIKQLPGNLFKKN